MHLLESLGISLGLIEHVVLRRACTLNSEVTKEDTSTLTDSVLLEVALSCVMLQSYVGPSLSSMNLDADWFRTVTTLNRATVLVIHQVTVSSTLEEPSD